MWASPPPQKKKKTVQGIFKIPRPKVLKYNRLKGILGPYKYSLFMNLKLQENLQLSAGFSP